MIAKMHEDAAKKAAAAARNNMVPLICTGEKNHSSIASEAVGMASEECRIQVSAALSAVPDGAEVLLAYEPVWAIRAFMPVHVTKEIGEMITGRKGVTSILYGGSAIPGTFSKIADVVDGLFLGRFARDLDSLLQVMKEVGSACEA